MSSKKPTAKPSPPQALTLKDVTITWEQEQEKYSMTSRELARFLALFTRLYPRCTWDGPFHSTSSCC